MGIIFGYISMIIFPVGGINFMVEKRAYRVTKSDTVVLIPLEGPKRAGCYDILKQVYELRNTVNSAVDKAKGDFIKEN